MILWAALLATPSVEDAPFVEWFQEWRKLDQPPWVQVGAPDNPLYMMDAADSYIFIYAEEIKRDKYISYWEHMYFKNPRPDKKYILTRIEMDCGGKFRLTAQSTYRSDDSQSFSLDRTDGWIFLRPNSGRADLEKILCNEQK